MISTTSPNRTVRHVVLVFVVILFDWIQASGGADIKATQHTLFTHIHIFKRGESTVGETDNFLATCAMRSLKFGRVREFFKIVFIRSIPYIHFKLVVKALTAFFACLPCSFVLFSVMIATEREAAMIARTTV